MNYCPETVLVHSSFLLADKKAAHNVQGAEKVTCRELAQIVSGAIREVTGELLREKKYELLRIEVRQLEFKIHSWIFSSLLKKYEGFEFDGSPHEEYFDTFPPLPEFDISFYLEVVKELEWKDLLVECLCAVGVKNAMLLLDDLIKSLVKDPSCENRSVFLCLFDSLLMSGTQSFLVADLDSKTGLSCGTKSLSSLLIEGMGKLRKEICNTASQLDALKKIVEFTVSSIVGQNFGENNKCKLHCILPVDWTEGHSTTTHEDLPHAKKCDGCAQETNDGLRQTVETAGVQLECYSSVQVHEQDERVQDLVVSCEIAACIDLLCRLILDDWTATSHWIKSDLCDTSVGQIDCGSWHPLHSWLVKLYGVVSLLISCSFDSKILLQAMTLQTGLAPYIKKHCTRFECNWIDAFQKRKQIEQSCCREEFSCPFESVDLLLFKPESAEEQYKFYLERVNDRLQGYKECFDWLLGAEEFHGESDWLECMENHAVEMSDSQQALKMVDIISMQHQVLSVDKMACDKVYRTIKKILFNLLSTLPWLTQEQTVEYAVCVGFAQDSVEDSIFFHPWYASEERTRFHQELVMIFNKLVDVSSDDGLQCAVSDILRVSLVSPHLTLHKMVHEGVKNAGHTKTICHVLQRLPLLCELRVDNQDSSMTLLCSALMSAAMRVSSRKQEIKLLDMVAMMLAPSASKDQPSAPLLDAQEFIEAAALPFLNNSNSPGGIPTVLVLKLLNTSLKALKMSTSHQLASLKEHLLPIVLCLCELLNQCNVFWDGLAPDHSLSEVEELRSLVLKALNSEMEICFEVLKTNPSFVRAVEWLYRRLRDGFDWTIPLHLEPLFKASNIKYKFPVPCCLFAVCGGSGDKWTADADLVYGAEDVFTVLFEYCRVSDSSLKKILESLVPDKLTVNLTDNRRRVVTSLTQVLAHCTWTEWQRILATCQHLIKTNVLKAKVSEVERVPWIQHCSDQDVYQLSALLLETMEVLRSPACSSWATPHVWFHLSKHYVTAVKEIADGLVRLPKTNALMTAALFTHVCYVMTAVPADLADKVFVLALDLVARPSISDCDVTDHLRSTISSLPSEVYKAALMQKLNKIVCP